jgi:hypothetical protein
VTETEDGKQPLEEALADLESHGSDAEDHEGRLGALERLRSELEEELEERDPESRSRP